MKIGVIDIVTSQRLSQFRKDKIDVLVFTQLGSHIDYRALASEFKLVNAFDEISKANWFNYDLISEKLKHLRSTFPDMFTYKGYDLEIPLKKDLYWAYFYKHALLYEANKFNKDSSTFIFYNDRSPFKKKLALLRKIFLYKHQGFEIQVDSSVKDLDKKVGFRLNDRFMIDVYGDLFDKLGIEWVLPYQSIYNKEIPVVNKQMHENFGLNFSAAPVKHNYFVSGFIERWRLFFQKEDPDFSNTFIYIQNNLRNYVDQYEKLFASGLRKVLINAGENEGEGNVLCMVAKRFGAVTFNYMNGTKAMDPHNLDTNFDFWFMPDRATKELLGSFCHLQDKQLPITGHILQDTAANHTYSGTLDEIKGKMEGKKIIAFLTSRIFATEKQDVLSLLNEYLDRHEDLIVLVRKHPTEPVNQLKQHDRIIPVPDYSERMVQKSLFDLLFVSDVVISLASTVSFQASWFNKPSLNYEVAEKSRLSYMDNERIFHLNSLFGLEKSLDDFLYKGKKIPSGPPVPGASEIIATILRNS